MKLLHLSPVLCACLVACGEAETAANSTTSPDANTAPAMKTVSFAGDHGASTANDPKTGTVNPFGGNGGASSDPSPSTRIVERTGIDPKTKTINPFAGKDTKLTADGVNPTSTPGTRKATETGKIKTGTVNPFGGKDTGKPAKSTKEKPSKGTDSKEKPTTDSKGKPTTDSKGKPTTDSKDKPTTDSKDKPSKDKPSKDKSGN